MKLRRPTLALLAAAAFSIPATGAAAELRYQLLVNGDFTLFGNTLAHDCAAGVTPLVGTVGACGTNTGDSGVDIWWRSNPAGNSAAANNTITLAQSQSTALLSIPATATVRYARLYWGATLTTNVYDTAATLVTPDGATHALTADRGWTVTRTAGSEYWYQSSVDITALVKALAEPRGAYTFSGADSRALVNLNSETSFDAWWVVVFYEDSADPALRQLTLFDGLDYVQTGGPANVTLGGFLVPSGGWDAKLGVVTYEGDSAFTGDQLLFQGYKSTGPAPGTLTTLSDAQNPADNFFNGTRSWLGAARTVVGDLPRYSGLPASMQSFDMDVVDLKALGAIAPGDDSASIRASTTLDVFALGAFITSINTLKPSFITTTKSAVNLTRVDGAFGGDVIEYTIDTANTGNDPSIQTVMEDPLPAGMSYVPGSLQIVSGANAGSKTDAAGDDQAEYDPVLRKVTVRLGTGATAFVGGSMAIGETAQIKFRVTIDPGASGVLQNQAAVLAAGLNGEPVRSFPSNPPFGTGTTDVPVDQCLTDAECGGSTPACWTSATPNVCVGCLSDSYCSGATPICDLTVRTCVGLSTVTPVAQEKTTVAGTPAPFSMTLTSHLAGGVTYDLDVNAGGCTWPIELRTSGGALVATLTSGVWTIQPGGDTNADGLPDFGATSGGGGTTAFILQLAPPGGTAIGAQCVANLLATGGGVSATASATLHVGAGATFTPDYTGVAAKTVSRGGDVGFPGIVQNNRNTALDYTLAANVTATPAAGTLAPAVFYSDPNGDGDWSDGAVLTTTGSIPAFGGKAHVVLVLRAATSTGTALPTGTVLDATATATNGATVATQLSQARVQYAATYSDAARTLVQGRFAPCDTVYLGAKLLPSGFPFRLEWYSKASPVRGVDTPVRAVDPWAVSGGSGTDQLVAPADALGTWTVIVVQKTTPTETVVDTITFTVERAGTFLSLGVPPRIGMADGLSVSAQVRNDNLFAPFDDSGIAYVVTDGVSYVDGTGTFVGTPSTTHATSSLTVAAGATGSDAWAMGNIAWPSPGTYRVDAEWRLSCAATPTIATATATFEVVPSPPVIGSPTEGSTVTTSLPTFTGTALPGASVTISIGAATCATVADGLGSFTCTFTTPIADGARSASAVQTVGGSSSDAASVGFTVDATTSVAFTSPAQGSTLNGTAAPGGTVSFAGTNESGATVTVAVDGGSAFPAAVSGTTWSYSRVLADGPHSAVARATDPHGNWATDTVSFTVDATTFVTIDSPAFDANLTAVQAPGGLVTVRGAGENGAIVDVTIGATTIPVVVVSGLWEATFSLTDGFHVVSATATDLEGNPASATSQFTLDANPPLPPLLDGLVSPTNAPTVTVTGTAEPSSVVELFLDGVSVGTTTAAGDGSFTFAALAVSEGSHAFTAHATDALGNVSLSSAPVAVVVDRSEPAPVLASPASPTRAATVTVFGTAAAGATVELFLDGASVGTTTAAGDGSFSFAGVPLTETSHAFVARATDGLGNVSPDSNLVTVVVDRSEAAPVLASLTSPTNAATVTVTGTAGAGTTVELFLDGVSIGTTTAAGDGSFSFANLALLEGSRSFTARATDSLGNVSPDSNTVTVVVDRSEPAPVLASLTSPTNAATVTVTGTAGAGASVELFLDGVSVGTTTAAGDGSFSFAGVAVTEGSRSFTARATDSLGNVSPDSNTVTVVVDRSEPAPVLASLASPTSAATVTVTGTAGAGAAVELFLDGVSAGTTTAAGDGSFSFADVALTEGSRSFAARATDGLGNVSPYSNTVTVLVDRSEPAPVLASLASPTSAATVTVTGTAGAGATVELFLDGVSVGTTTAAGDGSFSFADVALTEGSHGFTAVATDALGNVSPDSNTVTVVVDRSQPAPVLASLTSPTSAATVDVTGTADPGVTVELFLDGVSVGTTTAAGDGSFAFAGVAVAEGSRSFTARATDGLGNLSPYSNTVTVVVDRSEPAPVLASLASPTSAATVTVTGTAGAGATVELFLDGVSVGTTTAAGDGSFSFADVALTEGSHGFRAVATDGLGNVSPSSNTVTVVVDRSQPAPVLASLTSPTNAATVTVTGTAAAGVTVELFLDGAPVGTTTAAGDGSFSFAGVAVAEGSRSFTARATDGLGNVSPYSNTVTVLVDRSEPAPVLASLTSPTNAATVTVNGTAAAAVTVELFLDGVSVGTTTAAGDGSFSFSGVAVVEGSRSFTARATDGLGNVSPYSNTVTVLVDRSEPAPVLASLPSPTNAATATVNGTAAAGVTVELFLDGVSVGTTTAAGDGSFAFSGVSVTEGSRSFTARATDGLGNASPYSNTVTVVVDRSEAAPVLASLASPTNAATVTVNGTAAAGVTVELFLDGASVGTTTAAGDGSFSFAGVSVTEGSRSFTARATDGLGNVSPDSNAVSLVVDRTPPPIAITAPSDGATLAPGSIAISGTTEAGAAVELTIDGVTYPVTAAPDGTFTVTVTLAAGSWTVSATARDAVGNVGSAAPVTFTTVDGATPPTPEADPQVTGGGGCSCSPAQGGSPATLVLLLAALPFLPRRRRPAAR